MLLRYTGIAAVLLAATACSTPAPSETPVSAGWELTMQVNNSMQFTPAAITVKSGQPLQVTLENTGGMAHDLTLTDGVAQPVKIEAKGGETATATFIIDKPGTYTFVCSQPAHALLGMRGTVTVQ